MLVRFILLCLAVATPALAQTAEDAALAAPLRRLVEAINQAAPAPPAGVFTRDCVVLDDFPPYHWSGHATAITWYKDLIGATPQAQADFRALHGQLSVQAPRFSRITGDTAYLVVPAMFLFNTDPHTRIRQSAQWVISERKVRGRWLIAGHGWGITAESKIKP